MRRKHTKRMLNILLIPDSESPPKNLRIRYTTLWLLIIGVVVFVGGAVFGMITYTKVLRNSLQKDEFERENIQLRDQVKDVNRLEQEFKKLKNYSNKVRKALKGYVTLSEKVDPKVVAYDESPVYKQPPQNISSLFSYVPVKAPVIGFVSQEFNRPVHNGIDIVASVGTPIKAAADGIVVFSDRTNKDGYMVILCHPAGYQTVYRHNLRNAVTEGEIVQQGDVVAFLGNSGETSSGPHLHFEIWQNGKQVNPRPFLSELK